MSAHRRRPDGTRTAGWGLLAAVLLAAGFVVAVWQAHADTARRTVGVDVPSVTAWTPRPTRPTELDDDRGGRHVG